MRPIHRRTVLRGAGGIAIALPLLEAMLPRRGSAADGDVPPSRFVVMFSPNGTLYDRWLPVGSKTDYAFIDPANPGKLRILAPLEPHKADVVVLEGIDMHSRNFGPGGNGHDLGMAHMLTANVIEHGPSGLGEAGVVIDGTVTGPSIDQVIADHIVGTTPHRSLEFGAAAIVRKGLPMASRMCHRGRYQVLPPENDPRAAFDKLFLDLEAEPAELAALRFKRRSVLDKVMDDFAKLDGKLGSGDSIKLEAHLDAIRELEMSLAGDHGLLEGCALPTQPGELDFLAGKNMPAVGKMQMDLMVMALACDMTRVASLQWSTASSNVDISWVGDTGGRNHHNLSHDFPGNATITEQLVKVNHWYAQQFAYLVAAMKQVDEMDGSLLDHSLVMWSNELGDGAEHSRTRVPFVLAGAASGAIEPGRWLSYGGRAHNDLYVSLLRAFGKDVDTFGVAEACEGPLPEL